MQCDGVGNCSSLAHCKPGGGVWGAAALDLRTRASWHFPAWPVLFCKALGGSFTSKSLNFIRAFFFFFFHHGF